MQVLHHHLAVRYIVGIATDHNDGKCQLLAILSVEAIGALGPTVVLQRLTRLGGILCKLHSGILWINVTLNVLSYQPGRIGRRLIASFAEFRDGLSIEREANGFAHLQIVERGLSQVEVEHHIIAAGEPVVIVLRIQSHVGLIKVRNKQVRPVDQTLLQRQLRAIVGGIGRDLDLIHLLLARLPEFRILD